VICLCFAVRQQHLTNNNNRQRTTKRKHNNTSHKRQHIRNLPNKRKHKRQRKHSTIRYVNVTILNNTGNATDLIPLSLSSGTTSIGYWNATIDTTTLNHGDGQYNLSVNATNANALINISQNTSITIDNTPANVTIVTPENGTSASGNLLINVSANDTTSKVFNVTVRLTTASGSTVTDWQDLTLNSGNIDQGYWDATFDTKTVTDDTYNITANATDFAGNQNVVNISQIIIHNIIGTTLDANTSANITFNGSSENANLGTFMATGDINNDGIDDIIMAAEVAHTARAFGAGQVYVFYGSDSAGFGPGNSFDVNISPNITFNGSERNAFFGSSLATGDINNDGIDDIIIGAQSADAAGASSAGQVYVFYGSNITGYGQGNSFDANTSAWCR